MKVLKILNCKNSLLLGLLFVVTFFPILMIMIMTNAHAAELLTLKNENNSTVFENAYNKTTTTITSNATIENNLDDKIIPQQEEVLQLKQIDDAAIPQQEEVLQLKQIDYTEVGNNNSSTSSVNSTQTEELAQTENGRSSSQGNVTIEAVKNSEFKSPRVSYVENENSQLTPLDYENNYRGSSYNDKDNSESSSSSSRDGDKSYNDKDNSESRAAAAEMEIKVTMTRIIQKAAAEAAAEMEIKVTMTMRVNSY